MHIQPGHEFGEDATEEALLAGVMKKDMDEEHVPDSKEDDHDNGGHEHGSRSTSDGVGGVLSADLVGISEAIAHDAAKAARTVEAVRKKGTGRLDRQQIQNETDLKDKQKASSKVLFIIYSNSEFYDTRIKWARETWAKKLDSSQYVIIGDQVNNITVASSRGNGTQQVDSFAGAHVHQSRCKSDDKSIEMCCKYAEAVVVAQTMMWQNPNLQWAYMADDDSYIRASALERELLKQPHTRPRNRGMVLGNYGCVTSNRSDVLCGSSGYAANRWAIDIMAGGDPAGFVQEALQNCNRCGSDARYNTGLRAGAGLSEVIHERGIERRKLDGIYGWLLDKSCFEFALESDVEPLLYHSITKWPQMELLHRLFDHASSISSNSSNLDALGGCVEFRGNVQCAASRAAEDRPWHRGTSLCQRLPQMPHLPAFFGCFALLLLFIIVCMFLWAGLRTKVDDWDGWKVQTATGLRWHSFPMQGRSRMR